MPLLPVRWFVSSCGSRGDAPEGVAERLLRRLGGITHRAPRKESFAPARSVSSTRCAVGLPSAGAGPGTPVVLVGGPRSGPGSVHPVSNSPKRRGRDGTTGCWGRPVVWRDCGGRGRGAGRFVAMGAGQQVPSVGVREHRWTGQGTSDRVGRTARERGEGQKTWRRRCSVGLRWPPALRRRCRLAIRAKPRNHSPL